LLPDPWRCPATGIAIRTAVNNRDPSKCPVRIQRARILADAEQDEGFQRELLLACRESPQLFINLFGWTKRQREQDESGFTVLADEEAIDVPYILWQCQMDAIDEMAIHLPYKAGEKGKGGNCVIDKSREMGASWLVLAYMLHQWRFIKGRNFILLSRKEELVDTRYVVDSLFGKVDYMISFLPSWMRPEINRAENRLANLNNNNTFTGETTSQFSGQSQRAAACLIDEAAKIPNLEAISRNMGETVVVQFHVSTPDKTGIAFTRIRNNPATTLIPLHWSRHPEKAIGRFIGEDGKWHSPWYDEQCKIWAHDPKYVAVNYDMDHSSAGDLFFPSVMIAQHRAKFQCDPCIRGELVIDSGKTGITFKKRTPKFIQFVPLENGKWQLWFPLTRRPPQDDQYVMGADIGMGVGAANSAIQVGSQEHKRLVANFVSSHILPEDLAREMVKAAIWFGGHEKPAFLAWEANGYGEVFGRIVMKYHWPYVYKRVAKDQRSEQKSKKLGWWNNPTSILTLLEQLRQAQAADEFVIPDEYTLREQEDYMNFEDGSVGPAGLVEIPERARKNHGDRVVSVGILWEAMRKAQVYRPPKEMYELNDEGKRIKVEIPGEKEENLSRWTG